MSVKSVCRRSPRRGSGSGCSGRSGRRVVAALLAMMLGAAVISVLPGAAPASADGVPADSAMTVSGKGDFANLKVTVSQTKNLINQAVTVSWTGGVPTLPQTGGFSTNFLQVMQCWGDDPAGPDRTQCQFGGGVATNLQAGSWTRSRQLTYDVVDSKEKLTLPAGTSGNAYVPFWPAGGDKPTAAVTSGRSDFFDSQITNEIPLARTHGDGTGQEFFEIQTVRQAAGLGCGELVATGGVSTARKCWLVVVPRGSTEVDGSPRSGTPSAVGGFLDSSPLSQSNWDNRIAIPLEFLPVGQACPIGAPERRMVGHELAVEAVSRWQPALCAGGGALYSYGQLTDDLARSQVSDGSSPGLAFITNPVAPAQAPPSPLVYAPVGLSGLTIAFNIEHQPSPIASTDKLLLDGQRFTSMKLTPRLVAKLLTQSYQQAVAGYPSSTPDYLKNNPRGLTVDPEFLDLNHEYTDFAQFNTPPDALVQLGGSDVTSLLWNWVKADPDASAFLAGTPDRSGMVVNPNNKGLPLPTSTFPVNDQSCANIDLGGVGGAKLTTCTLDIHPFTIDMHDAGLAASRGDSKGQVPDLGPGGNPIVKKAVRQSPNQRSLLAVVDAATATRYGLPTASLRNAAGQFVASTTTSLLAGEKAMKPSAVPGVLASDPGATDPAAYPLTALSYAVTSPTTLDAAAGKDYATFLRYAVGPGQQPGDGPGQLPAGMTPLPDALRTQTAAAAATIEAQAGKDPASGPPTPQPTGAGGVLNGSVGSPGSVAAGAGATATSPSGGSGASSPAAVPPGASAPAANVPSAVQQPVARVRRTPPLSAPAVGALLLTILICGALAATSSPILQSPAIHRLGVTVRRRLQKGVTPTKQ
jgi:hypothetical protein